MRFNKHSHLEGLHAFLSPSNNAWSNYEIEKLERRWTVAQAAKRGTELHELAHQLIRLGQRLPASKKTLNMYVNDCIGWKLRPEQTLYYSPNCFGHADAIGLRGKKLRVSDYKSGETHVSVRQLEIYAALFCLEYGYKPWDLEFELRIYQNDEVQLYQGDPDVIFHLMETIKLFDQVIERLREEADQ